MHKIQRCIATIIMHSTEFMRSKLLEVLNREIFNLQATTNADAVFIAFYEVTVLTGPAEFLHTPTNLSHFTNTQHILNDPVMTSEI